VTSWTTITDFGDSAVMLPAATMIGLWLLGGGAWRATGIWLALFGAGAAVVAATKIAFLGWGLGSAALDFTGISGHTMLGTAVTLTALHLLSRDLPGRRRIALMAAGLGVSFTIGISRIALEYHSPTEVIAGLIVGSLVAAGFASAARPLPEPELPRSIMVAALVGVALVMHGHAAGSQDLLARLALYLSGHTATYTRALYAVGVA
jgi:membrane-associated phospholipid phosphatase